MVIHFDVCPILKKFEADDRCIISSQVRLTTNQWLSRCCCDIHKESGVGSWKPPKPHDGLVSRRALRRISSEKKMSKFSLLQFPVNGENIDLLSHGRSVLVQLSYISSHIFDYYIKLCCSSRYCSSVQRWKISLLYPFFRRKVISVC